MKFEGEVRELELIPALVELGSEGFTGALRFEADSIIKIVYFKDGAVLSASTNDRSDSIDEILLKSGKVSREHVKQALSKRKDDETLGDALLGLGFITRKELSWARRVQLVGVLRSILTWDSGSYTLVADYLPKREEGPAFPLEQVVLELVLTDGDRSKYDELLDSGNAVFRPSDIFEERFPHLGLNQEAESVVRLINGTRTASEVVAESPSDAFNVYKLMHALNLLGLLDRSQTSINLGLGAPVGDAAPAISPTIELPMDFETTPAEPAADLDFGAPDSDSPAVDMSWQEPAAEEPPSALEPSSGELLPSIDVDIPQDDSGYEYEPSVPEDRLPGMDRDVDTSSLESLSSLEIPETPVSEPEPMAQPRTVLVTTPPDRGGRKLAFLVVAVIVLGALAYASYVYFTRTVEKAPIPQASVQPEPAPSSDTGVEASTTDTGETPAETAPAEEPTARPEPVQAKPPVQPAPRPTSTTPPASGRYADVARQHESSAAGVPYTVQFALLCQDYSVENAMKVGGSDFWFIPITYQGRSCYRAFWGRYATRADAERAAGQVPASLRGGKAVVVEPAKLVN